MHTGMKLVEPIMVLLVLVVQANMVVEMVEVEELGA